jgi:hypothetical protein
MVSLSLLTNSSQLPPALLWTALTSSLNLCQRYFCGCSGKSPFHPFIGELPSIQTSPPPVLPLVPKTRPGMFPQWAQKLQSTRWAQHPVAVRTMGLSIRPRSTQWA